MLNRTLLDLARSTVYPRTLGVLTLCYGAYTAARPGSLAHASELESREKPASPTARALETIVGGRDMLCGAAMAVLPAGRGLQSAVAVRVACDVVDIVGFGRTVPPAARAKVVAVAADWGVLCASSLPGARARR